MCNKKTRYIPLDTIQDEGRRLMLCLSNKFLLLSVSKARYRAMPYIVLLEVGL